MQISRLPSLWYVVLNITFLPDTDCAYLKNEDHSSSLSTPTLDRVCVLGQDSPCFVVLNEV